MSARLAAAVAEIPPGWAITIDSSARGFTMVELCGPGGAFARSHGTDPAEVVRRCIASAKRRSEARLAERLLRRGRIEPVMELRP